MRTTSVPKAVLPLVAAHPPFSRMQDADVLTPTTVIHVNDMQPGDIYIGRGNGRRCLKGSPFANPFVIGKHGSRAEVITKYRAWLLDQPELMAQIPTLRGKRLACWCKPDHDCHGDVLAELADASVEREDGRDAVLGRDNDSDYGCDRSANPRASTTPAQMQMRMEL